jgi:YtkA-like
MAPGALARRVIAGLLACCGLAIGCSRAATDVTATWKIEPTPPVAGTTTIVRVVLRRPDGSPVSGAKLRLEAHMSHPGMAPVTADVVEQGNGTYETRLQLSMAGDWAIVVTGELADGRRITRETQVPSVLPAGETVTIP